MGRVGLQVDLQGLDEALSELRELPRRTARGVFRSAIQAGATTGAKLARARAPSGSIAKAVKGTRRPTNGLYSARSTIDAFSPLSHLFEYGYGIVKKQGYIPGVKKRLRLGTTMRGGAVVTKQKRRGAKLPVIGRVPARPFMRPAIDSGQEAIQAAIKAKLASGIAKKRAASGID